MSPPPLRREDELLLSLARLSLPASHRAKARTLVGGGIDWAVLSSSAKRHGVELLAHRHLSGELADLCPAPVLESMASAARAIATFNAMVAAELAGLLPELEAAGCEPVVVKGPALAVTVYGDLSSRPFGDVDVVVAPPSRVRAWTLLESRGWASSIPVPARWQDAWRRSTNEQLFKRPGSALVVDLHWALTAPGFASSLDLDEVRPRLERVRTPAGDLRTLGPEDALLFLCSHGTKHDWVVLGWLVDVAELVRSQPRLDWDIVLRWSRGPGRRRPVQLGLRLAHRLLEAPVPAAVLADGARDPHVAGLAALVEGALFEPASAPQRGLWAQMFGAVGFQATESWADRARLFHEWVLMPHAPDYGWVSLPAWAAPAYYLVRPLRLLVKHRGGLLGLSRPRRRR